MTSLDSSNFEKLDLIRFSLILAIRGEFLKVAKFRRLAQNAAPGVPDLSERGKIDFCVPIS